MNLNGIVQIVLYLVVLLALVKPLGSFMARVYQGEPCGLDRVLGPVENMIYRACGIRREEEMTWQAYAGALLLFSLAGVLSLYLLQRLQGILPLNPQKLPAVSPDSSFNTAVSFVTNTNWQGYGGETTMGYLTQMAGLAVQNFVSAASGMAVLVASHSGICPAHDADHRQLLGRPDPQHPLHPASSLPGPGTGPLIPGSGAKL